MGILLIVFWSLFSKNIIHAANLPLLFQLNNTYHSQTYQEFVSPDPIIVTSTKSNDIGTTLQPEPQILGIAISEPDTSLPAKTTTIALLGDSMVDTLGQTFFNLTQSLYRYYPHNHLFRSLNFGKGSDTIEGGLNRLNNLIVKKPDIVVVESFAYNNFGNTASGFNQHQQALSQIIATIHAKLPASKIVILATIAPNPNLFAKGVFNFDAPTRLEKTQTISKYLQRTITYAQTENLPIANAYQASLVGDIGDPLYIDTVDNIHPSSQGKELIGNILAKTIYDNHLIDN